MALFRLDASIRVEVGWMRRDLSGVWHLDLNVVEAELTQVGVDPALDQFQEPSGRLRHETDLQFHPQGPELIFVAEAAHAPAAA